MRRLTCVQVQTHLPALLDGELSGALTAGLEAHLAHCGACQAVAEGRVRLAEALRRAGAPARVPTGLQRRVQAALRAPPRLLGARRGRWAAAALAGGGLLALLLGQLL